MLSVTLSRGKYTNESAVENVLHYISCSHNTGNDCRECLIFFSPNLFGTIDQMAYFMKVTQRLYRSCTTEFKRIHHLVITFPEEKTIHKQSLFQFAEMAAGYFSYFGFQTAASVFFNAENRKYEVHIAVNTINSYNGMAQHFDSYSLKILQGLFSWYFQLANNP